MVFSKNFARKKNFDWQLTKNLTVQDKYVVCLILLLLYFVVLIGVQDWVTLRVYEQLFQKQLPKHEFSLYNEMELSRICFHIS